MTGEDWARYGITWESARQSGVRDSVAAVQHSNSHNLSYYSCIFTPSLLTRSEA